MMKHVEVELVGDATNAMVVRLPSRRFPGIVIQGDSLAVLTGTAKRALGALNAANPEEAADELQELCELLNAYQREYEGALRAAGFELPYVVSAERR